MVPNALNNQFNGTECYKQFFPFPVCTWNFMYGQWEMHARGFITPTIHLLLLRWLHHRKCVRLTHACLKTLIIIRNHMTTWCKMLTDVTRARMNWTGPGTCKMIFINLRISKDTIPPGHRSRYSDYLWAGRFGYRIRAHAGFPATVQTDPKAHPASCTNSTGSFPETKHWSVVLTTQFVPVPGCEWVGVTLPYLICASIGTSCGDLYLYLF